MLTAPTPSSIDVVVLTWNDPGLAAIAVGSALDDPDLDVRVWLIDNGSTTPASAHKDPRVVLHRSEANLGVARGRNVGISLGTAPFVCLLDSDAVLRPGALARLVSVVASEPSIVLAAPVFEDQSAEASGGLAPTVRQKLRRALGRSANYHPAPRRDGEDVWDVDFAIGACQVIRRTALDAVGGLDERYFYGPEDVDLCLRLRLAGWRVVQVEGAPVRHPPRRRNRKPVTLRGLRHAAAIARHQWRHRAYVRRAGVVQ